MTPARSLLSRKLCGQSQPRHFREQEDEWDRWKTFRGANAIGSSHPYLGQSFLWSPNFPSHFYACQTKKICQIGAVRMITRLFSAALRGVEAQEVEVEVNAHGADKPTIIIVGKTFS
jgi:hypothetical protein